MSLDSPTVAGTAATLECARVDLWLAALDGGDLRESTLESTRESRRCLAPDEVIRADRFLNQATAQQYVAARNVLRQILGLYLKCDPRDVALEYGESGKPALVPANRAADLQFNVSHACGHAVYAVCTTADVGVDIECDDGRIDPTELAPTICSAHELRQFQAHSLTEQRVLFFRLWTRKEAYLKCLGSGLNTEPSSLEMSMADVPEVCAGTGYLLCSVRTFELPGRFQVSVAARSPLSEVRSFRWWPDRTPVLPIL